MEISATTHSTALAVLEEAHVDAARRRVVRLARELHDDDRLLDRITVVAQEMARNLVRHGGGGELVYRGDAQAIHLLAIDTGPGMQDVAQCLSDNYSTTGTMGAGLGAIRRMSDGFDLYSRPGLGTVIYARFDLDPLGADTLQAGAVSTPYPGEEVCGDGWARLGNRLMVCDGLGHGVKAQQASHMAREAFLRHDPGQPLLALIEQLHRALASSRGGALAVAEVLPERGELQYCGVGNIAGTLLGGALYGDKSRSLVSANGTLGYRIGRVQTFSYPWEADSVLLMASDGINSRLDMTRYPGLGQRSPEVIAGVIHRDFRRHNDDVTAVILKRGAHL